jgi:hypothetical protein
MVHSGSPCAEVGDVDTQALELGVKVPDVLLPKEGTDLTKWAVIACDQYETDKKYWADVEALVGDAPSTRYLMLPEVYLDEKDRLDREADIPKKMKVAVEDVFGPPVHAPVFVERRALGRKRWGVVLCLDVEQYDFTVGFQALIKATEKTIPDRIPPRARIRKEAPIELPHIMVLIDDPDKKVIESVAVRTDEYRELYNFDLMQNGGHLTGWAMDEVATNDLLASLKALIDPETYAKKYGVPADSAPMLFGVGDGNHSLATAKACWEELKKYGAPMDHPARYALVEIENIHDDGIIFEPIHRLILNVQDFEAMIGSFLEFLNKTDEGASFVEEAPKKKPGMHCIQCLSDTKNGYLVIEKPSRVLEVASLQASIDAYLASGIEGVSVAYIHGTQEVEAKKSDKNMGFIVGPMPKGDLFKTVLFDGVLPKKTFSMGEADEKRFYMEAKMIV